MKVNFYLKNPTGDYETWIYCSISYRNQRVKVYTTNKIHPKDWNEKKQQARQSFTGYSTFNRILHNIKGRVDEIDLEWRQEHKHEKEILPLPADILKQKLRKYLSQETKQEREENQENTFWGYYKNFLLRMENGTRVHIEKGTPLAKGTIFQFHNLKRHLEQFEKTKKGHPVTFESIDLVFYKKFVDHLTTKLKLGPNTIGKLITNLKVFMREAFEDKLTTNNTFTYRKFKSINFTSDTVYLNLAEIKEMQGLDLSTAPRLERVRDLFIIGCFTGLRFSDIVSIRPGNIDNGMITIKQAKTGEEVIIPYGEDVQKILEKYGNSIRKISNQKYNEYLSLVCEKCVLLQKEISIEQITAGKEITVTGPKHKFISSHTARRSFATNENAAGDLDRGEIMALTGHKTEKSFLKYIREKPEETAKRIKEKLIQRELKRAEIKNHLMAV
jgi:integrase